MKIGQINHALKSVAGFPFDFGAKGGKRTKFKPYLTIAVAGVGHERYLQAHCPHRLTIHRWNYHLSGDHLSLKRI